MGKATIKITDEVRDVLTRSTITGNKLVLNGQLDPDAYRRVNKVLLAAGGKWDRKVGGHVFASSPAAIFDLALKDGEITDPKKLFQAFFTPPETAKYIVELLGPVDPKHRFLEPSAGEGAIVLAYQDRGGNNIACVEIQPGLCEKLREHAGIYACEGDFLKIKPGENGPWPQGFDRIAMNPPFTGGQDVAHVMHAYKFLAPGGVLVAIMPPTWTFTQQSKYREFKAFWEERKGTWELLPPGTFSESGTNVNTGVVVIAKPAAKTKRRK